MIKKNLDKLGWPEKVILVISILYLSLVGIFISTAKGDETHSPEHQAMVRAFNKKFPDSKVVKERLNFSKNMAFRIHSVHKGPGMGPMFKIKKESERDAHKDNKRLKNAHPLLQEMTAFIHQHKRVLVVSTTRSLSAQKKAMAKGRTKTLKSLHLKNPSLAIDLVPYSKPLNWEDWNGYYVNAALASVWVSENNVRGCLVHEKKRRYQLEMGINWKFVDPAHFQLVACRRK